MKTIKFQTSILGKKMEGTATFDARYDIVKRGNGWAVAKDGEVINGNYSSRFAAAMWIPNVKFQ